MNAHFINSWINNDVNTNIKYETNIYIFLDFGKSVCECGTVFLVLVIIGQYFVHVEFVDTHVFDD